MKTKSIHSKTIENIANKKAPLLFYLYTIFFLSLFFSVPRIIIYKVHAHATSKSLKGGKIRKYVQNANSNHEKSGR